MLALRPTPFEIGLDLSFSQGLLASLPFGANFDSVH